LDFFTHLFFKSNWYPAYETPYLYIQLTELSSMRWRGTPGNIYW